MMRWRDRFGMELRTLAVDPANRPYIMALAFVLIMALVFAVV